MSLSDTPNNHKSFKHGKIILGSAVGGPIEVSLSSLEGPDMSTWDERTTEEYMRRVREKAKKQALQIMAKAKEEAEAMRRQAREQGYAEGQAEAAHEFENIRHSTEEALAEALDSIRQGAEEIWREHRRELTALVGASVEKITCLELDRHARKILEKLMDQAVEAVDMRRMLTIKVHPESYEDINDLMRRLKESHPQLGGWKVRSCPEMQPGGLLVESDSGLVDNSIEGRLTMVREILDQLTLADEDQTADQHDKQPLAEIVETSPIDQPAPSVDDENPLLPGESALQAESPMEHPVGMPVLPEEPALEALNEEPMAASAETAESAPAMPPAELAPADPGERTAIDQADDAEQNMDTHEHDLPAEERPPETLNEYPQQLADEAIADTASSDEALALPDTEPPKENMPQDDAHSLAFENDDLDLDQGFGDSASEPAMLAANVVTTRKTPDPAQETVAGQVANQER